MKHFSIYLNDKCVGECRASKKAAELYIKNVATIGTHMGEWRKLPNGYEYATTVGKYYRFVTGEKIYTGAAALSRIFG